MADQKIQSLTLKQLRYAVAAAEAGNVTEAAGQLHVSQPSISMAIAAIEAQLGRKLFVRRKGQGVTITSFGRSFVREARAVLDRAQGLAQLADGDDPVSGELSLGCFTDLAPYYVPDLLRRFALVKPAIRISFRDAGFDTLCAQLENGVLDLALTYDLGLNNRIERVVLKTLAPHAMLPAGHPLARQKSVSLKQLATQPLILTDQALSWQHVLELFHWAGAPVDVMTRASSFELQRSLVANGFGVAVAYTRPVGDRGYDGKALAIRPIRDKVPDHRILLAWSKDAPLSPATQAFANFVKARFAEQERSR
jgi:DNA-binding transcriptional LysR family regulator